MRILILMRGAPGCGKSTFIEKNGLTNYALSPDNIRVMVQSPEVGITGTPQISQKNDMLVWDILFKILEDRMQRGDFTVIDATNSKTSEMSRYKEMAKTYRYRMFCIDLTDIGPDECKRRNSLRSEFKRVPDYVIDKIYSRFETQTIPLGIVPVKPENGTGVLSEDDKKKIFFNKVDFNKYDNIHIIGDIHGCVEPLNEFFKDYSPSDFYIFTGDYIDKGIQNVETLKILFELAKKPNTFFLEGNHERWLWIYAHDGIARSKEFEQNTKVQLDAAKISKSEIRQFYRQLGQCAYFDFDGKSFTVCHGGISKLPDSFIATEQYVKGVGKYEDGKDVENAFFDNTSENDFLIHGHRNVENAPVQVNDRCYNLEGGIEFGGCLRIVTISHGSIATREIQNNTYGTFDYVEINKDIPDTVEKVIGAMRGTKYVREKKNGNISSFNFTEEAFKNKKWTDATVKARGLFINTNTNEIVARGYEKFFRINERPETQLEMLRFRLSFPVTAYVKENGFLGMVGYDSESDELVIASKSSLNGDHVSYLKDMLFPVISPNLSEFKTYLKNNNKCMAFEVVDMKNDPHIIDYGHSEIFLLDIIDREMAFSKVDYEKLKTIGKKFGLKIKEKAVVLNSWEEFYSWYNKVTKEGYKYNGEYIEGFVIEDCSGFMTKIKLDYYNQWKFMRSIADTTLKCGHFRYTSSLTTPILNYFYSFVKRMYKECHEKGEALSSMPIIKLRKEFFKEYPEFDV